jgi:hypothetical protein
MGAISGDYSRFHTPRVSHQCVILHASHIRIIPAADATNQYIMRCGASC